MAFKQLALGLAPLMQKMPTEPIMRQADIENGCRFVAQRAWGAGPHIVWAGGNPSNADGKRDDPTMLRMMSFSFRWGYGSMSVINPNPIIDSDPASARQRLGDPKTHWSYHRNRKVIREQVEGADRHMAIWGNLVEPHELVEFLDAARVTVEDTQLGRLLVPVTWMCLGVNQNGSPRHLLSRGCNRVPDDTPPRAWRRNV